MHTKNPMCMYAIKSVSIGEHQYDKQGRHMRSRSPESAENHCYDRITPNDVAGRVATTKDNLPSDKGYPWEFYV